MRFIIIIFRVAAARPRDAAPARPAHRATRAFAHVRTVRVAIATVVHALTRPMNDVIVIRKN